jgi:hypothetical protein
VRRPTTKTDLEGIVKTYPIEQFSTYAILIPFIRLNSTR